MATIRGDVTEEIICEVDRFGFIMQQNVIENDFNREYAPMATIKPVTAIEFKVTCSNDLYLYLNNSRLLVLAKITKADGRNIDANTAAGINLTLHSMFPENGVEFNGRTVGDTSQLFPYLSFVEIVHLQQKDSKDSTPVRRLDQGHKQARDCHRSRWEQCWTER